MITQVHVDGVELVEFGDFTKFHVEVDEGAGDVDAALRASGFGSLPAGSTEARISISALRRAVAGRAPAGWEEGFEAMVRFAASKGWVVDDGKALLGHVSTATEPGGR